MTAQELTEIRNVYDKLDVLEMEGRFEDADKYFMDNRWFFNFDYNGNWIGSVANENGWTA